jgi:hypothetical protein
MYEVFFSFNVGLLGGCGRVCLCVLCTFIRTLTAHARKDARPKPFRSSQNTNTHTHTSHYYIPNNAIRRPTVTLLFMMDNNLKLYEKGLEADPSIAERSVSDWCIYVYVYICVWGGLHLCVCVCVCVCMYACNGG